MYKPFIIADAIDQVIELWLELIRKEETMGYYEGWDNVWRNDMQAGWVCPRCEKFVQRGDEHSCQVTQPEKRIQVSDTWQQVESS